MAQIYLHIIFSTKGRVPYLRDNALRTETFLYIKGVCDNLECPSVQTGGWEDHIHVLCRFSRTIKVCDLIKEIKVASSTWIKDKSSRMQAFHWQAGYGAFSISPGHVDRLVKYIQDQDDHHRTESFQDELRRICKMYGVELDERYAWD